VDILIPDIGDVEDVEVIEICVAVGDEIGADDALVVIESDKASMEVPAGVAGTVTSIEVALGDQVTQGQLIARIDSASEVSTDEVAAADASEEELEAVPSSPTPTADEDRAEAEPDQDSVNDGTPPPTAQSSTFRVEMPDIGEAEDVVVIEVAVSEGSTVDADDLLVVVESDKASMEIPAGVAGVVEGVHVAEGDAVVEGTLLVTLTVDGDNKLANSPASDTEEAAETPADAAASKSLPIPQPSSARPDSAELEAPQTASSEPASAEPMTPRIYAGPAVRKLARELGVALEAVSGSGARGRIVKDDVKAYVKTRLAGGDEAESGNGIPVIDFERFGDIELQAMTRVQAAGAKNLHRSWLNVVHVTQHDEVDVTDMEDFRASLKSDAQAQGVKVTPVAFIVKACCHVLKLMPTFNASLDAEVRNFILKKYFHIGFAVDTDQGLVVPVIRNADQLGIFELSQTISDLAEKARTRKLSLDDTQGASFTISSLGNLGGTGFTPIVNAPEVAILGVSRLTTRPMWNGSEFVPRKMLPLSLSYDHRAINGAEGGRFMVELAAVLGDLRRLTL
jgi:pyruvate dehydrogenase E2 component (dihydrolipoamide acetyltransferase)